MPTPPPVRPERSGNPQDDGADLDGDHIRQVIHFGAGSDLRLHRQGHEGSLKALHRILGQSEQPLQGLPPPSRKLVRKHPVPPRHFRHTDARAEALRHDPGLHLVRPTPIAPSAPDHLDPAVEPFAPSGIVASF